MSPSDDHSTDMDDRTADALLAGRQPAAHASDLDLVVGFLDDLRSAGTGPLPVASPALAAVLAGAAPSPAASPAFAGVLAGAPPSPAASESSARHRDQSGRTLRVAFRLVTRLAAAGLVAKVGLGFAVAGATVSGAAVAGVPAARTVVAAVTPVEFPAPDRAPESPTSGRAAGPNASGASGPSGASGAPDAPGVPGVPDGASPPSRPDPRRSDPSVAPPGDSAPPATAASPGEEREREASAGVPPGPALGARSTRPARAHPGVAGTGHGPPHDTPGRPDVTPPNRR